MNQEIAYRGVTATPNDLLCTDGELETAIGLIPENGALAPLPQPAVISQGLPPETQARLVFIHRTPAAFDEPHYIYHLARYNGAPANLIAWSADGEHLSATPFPLEEAQLLSVQGMGNTLTLITSEGPLYLLWKGLDYDFLGPLPEIPDLEFGLEIEQKSQAGSSQGRYYYPYIYADTDASVAADAEQKNKVFLDTVIGAANKIVADHKDRFAFPFFVRYAFRLFDGTLTKHSAPVLMLPSTTINPVFRVLEYVEGSKDCFFKISARLSTAKFLFRQTRGVEGLEKWKDLIQGIEIFVTPPIYSYNQDPEVKDYDPRKHQGTLSTMDALSYGIIPSLKKNDEVTGASQPAVHRINSELETFGAFNSAGTAFELNNYTALRPPRKGERFYQELEAASTLYHYATYTLDEMLKWQTYSGENGKGGAGFATVKTDVSDVTTINTRPAMTDDVNSHLTVSASHSFVYNNRLHLANLDKRPFAGFPPMSSFQYLEPFTWGAAGETKTEYFDCYVWVRKKERTFKLIQEHVPVPQGIDPYEDAPGETPRWAFPYFYFPDPDAYHVAFINERTGSVVYSTPLKRHDFLNGAYAFSRLYGLVPLEPFPDDDETLAEHLPGTYQDPNQIYVSEAGNPFFFPPASALTVGNGEINALSSASQALSQGQFGQFPLYAFTTEGVWAMEVSATGTYAARQPITRDVCTNPAGITQLDNAVLFSTARGIMLLAGAQTECVTDPINAPLPPQPTQIPGLDVLHALAGHPASDSCLPRVPLSEFLSGAQGIYDYPHQRVVIFNPSITYAYALSLRSKQWGMMRSTLSHTVNAYPDALAVTHEGRIVSFAKETADTTAAFFLTRPIKLQMPHILKTIDTLIQRGTFSRGDVCTVLWGSRDLAHWQIVATSADHFLRGIHGTPYKYFRIGGTARLAPHQSLIGASVQLAAKLANQPR